MVAMVKANDVDLNPILVYDFTADGNPGGTFALDRSTGRLTLARPVDHEVQKQYSVGITVSEKPRQQINVKSKVCVLKVGHCFGNGGNCCFFFVSIQ